VSETPTRTLRLAATATPRPTAVWTLVGAADFNRDGHPDFVLFTRTIRSDLLLYKCRMREDEHEGLSRIAALLVREKLGNYRTTKFRSFSLVYL
jgi:hypothetical protein